MYLETNITQFRIWQLSHHHIKYVQIYKRKDWDLNERGKNTNLKYRSDQFLM